MALISGGGGGGGLPLTGGTLSGELTIDTAATTDQALELEGSRTSQHDVFRVDYPHTVLVVDSDGVFNFTTDDGLQAYFTATSNTGCEVRAVATSSAMFKAIRADGTSYSQVTTGQVLIHNSTGNLTLSPTLGATVFPSGLSTTAIASGALPTVSPASGTAFQCSANRDVFLTVPVTTDATANAATCKLELSPDNVTFSTLGTFGPGSALNALGAETFQVQCVVPAAWYVKLTASHTTLGTGTYY